LSEVRLLTLFLLLLAGSAAAQLPLTEDEFLARLKKGDQIPENLLRSRSVVFFPFTFTDKELEKIQSWFQRSGIDAVAYFDEDMVIAGRDASMEMGQYLIKREVSNLIFFKKTELIFSIYITTYNGKANFVEENQQAWYAEDRSLEQLMAKVYRTTGTGFKKENFLINEFPETIAPVYAINGQRNEFYAVDLKVDMLAVPRFNDPAQDSVLKEIMKMYPLKFTFTDPNTSEADLRRQGNLFVLRFVKARAKVAKQILGYDMTKSESAIVSIMYANGQPQLKNIPANDVVYKFYFKHIESGNVYLGNKWDADESWQQALINQIKGFKAEHKIN
jgi:hypothetical protein